MTDPEQRQSRGEGRRGGLSTAANLGGTIRAMFQSRHCNRGGDDEIPVKPDPPREDVAKGPKPTLGR